MKSHHEEGPPCRTMESLLQQLADGSLKGPMRWYAASHAARCYRCGNFLDRLKLTVNVLKESKKTSPDALARLRNQVREMETKE
ncbi:hypothetical protein BH11ARM1_BH11ARM1_16070 [soil metagenome]